MHTLQIYIYIYMYILYISYAAPYIYNTLASCLWTSQFVTTLRRAEADPSEFLIIEVKRPKSPKVLLNSCRSG